MFYQTADIIKIKQWLENHPGWGMDKVTDQYVEIWRNNKHHRTLSLPLDGDFSNIEKYLEEAISTIAIVESLPADEMYREIILDGLKLLDIIPFFKDKDYEGFILKWQTNNNTGEYGLYRTIDSEKLTPWNGECALLNDKNKRYLNELLKQFVRQVEI